MKMDWAPTTLQGIVLGAGGIWWTKEKNLLPSWSFSVEETDKKIFLIKKENVRW